VSLKLLLRADTEGRIKQVIVGGESGKGARPMAAEWVRRLRDETQEAGRAFFFKQWGDSWKLNSRALDGRDWNESPWPVPLPVNADGHPCLSLGYSA
jgi:protein gp37